MRYKPLLGVFWATLAAIPIFYLPQLYRIPLLTGLYIDYLYDSFRIIPYATAALYVLAAVFLFQLTRLGKPFTTAGILVAVSAFIMLIRSALPFINISYEISTVLRFLNYTLYFFAYVYVVKGLEYAAASHGCPSLAYQLGRFRRLYPFAVFGYLVNTLSNSIPIMISMRYDNYGIHEITRVAGFFQPIFSTVSSIFLFALQAVLLWMIWASYTTLDPRFQWSGQQ